MRASPYVRTPDGMQADGTVQVHAVIGRMQAGVHARTQPLHSCSAKCALSPHTGCEQAVLHTCTTDCMQTSGSVRKQTTAQADIQRVHARAAKCMHARWARLQAGAIARKQSGLHACTTDGAHAERGARMQSVLRECTMI